MNTSTYIYFGFAVCLATKSVLALDVAVQSSGTNNPTTLLATEPRSVSVASPVSIPPGTPSPTASSNPVPSVPTLPSTPVAPAASPTTSVPVPLSAPVVPVVPATPTTPVAPLASPASSPKVSCRPQIEAGFARLSQVSLKPVKTSEDAKRIVVELFGPPFSICEHGAYEEFLNQFSDYASGVLRPASAKEQGAQLLIALALLAQLPQQVPFEEGSHSRLVVQQTRANLHAVAEDVKQSRSRKGSLTAIDQLLSAVDSLPMPGIGTPPPPPVGDENTITVKLPTWPLPKWAVAELYEIQKVLGSTDPSVIKTGKEKLKPVLQWMADPHFPPPVVPNADAVRAPQGLMPDAVVQNLYELEEILTRYELWHTGSAKAAQEAQQKELQEARKKLDSIIKWIESAP